jgi:drug/metabolite transporter (DMT)-like permease
LSLSNTRLFGIFLVVVSAILWSTAGLFVRMADMDIWSILFWRSLFSCAALGLYVLLRNRGAGPSVARSFGWQGAATCLISVLAAIAYIASLQWTSVANVMTVYAALPFVATAIAFAWFGERVTTRFIIAGSLAFVGVAITVGAAVTRQDILGIVAAVVMTACFASQLVIARRYPSLDMTTITVAAAALCVVVALPLMHWGLPSPRQLLACALYGALTTGAAYVLVMMGSRLTGSGEAGFISMLDVVLGPFWVWLFYDERVGLAVFIGGAIVLLSVIWYLSGLGLAAKARAPSA